MKVLIGCEESQSVCKAFRRRGHLAFSNDLKPCSGGHPDWHIQDDVFHAIVADYWDLIILHPPCTYIACSGNAHYAQGKADYYKRKEAVGWTRRLWDFARNHCRSVALENPVGVLCSLGGFPKPQMIQPWQFGHDASKRTCLWLYHLPELQPTKIIIKDRYANQTSSGQNSLGSKTKHRPQKRAVTYPGIAEAMADQWNINQLKLSI